MSALRQFLDIQHIGQVEIRGPAAYFPRHRELIMLYRIERTILNEESDATILIILPYLDDLAEEHG